MKKNEKYESVFQREMGLIEKALQSFLPPAGQFPSLVHEAMWYSVFPGGKRFRPVLTLAACEASGGKAEDALIPAVSLELIHCYSLVHDDLPCMDNDDERRGKPTCHRQFGEAVALLAGDGLLTHALHLLSRVEPASRAVRLLSEISTASGTYGMIGGQVAELGAPKREMNLPMLDYISSHKTGKLIKASAVSGALAAGASKDVLARLHRYGEYVGLAFQFIDDALDGDGYLRLIKISELREKTRDLIALAKREIKPLGRRGIKLQAMADFLLRRMPRGNHVSVDR